MEPATRDIGAAVGGDGRIRRSDHGVVVDRHTRLVGYLRGTDESNRPPVIRSRG
jgi:hypothetical protein